MRRTLDCFLTGGTSPLPGLPPLPVPLSSMAPLEPSALASTYVPLQETTIGSELSPSTIAGLGKDSSSWEERVATKEDIMDLSVLLNIAMRRTLPYGATMSWFKLFRHVDSERSGLISYYEFVEMVRKPLKLSVQKLPDARLHAVWRALDTSGHGLLQHGEVCTVELEPSACPPA